MVLPPGALSRRGAVLGPRCSQPCFIQAQIEELDDQARQIEKRMVDLEMVERLEMDRLLAEHSKVESELHSYNQRILAAISVE